MNPDTLLIPLSLALADLSAAEAVPFPRGNFPRLVLVCMYLFEFAILKRFHFYLLMVDDALFGSLETIGKEKKVKVKILFLSCSGPH